MVVSAFQFSPLASCRIGKPSHLQDVRDDSGCGYEGGVQLMSHFNSAEKNPNELTSYF